MQLEHNIITCTIILKYQTGASEEELASWNVTKMMTRIINKTSADGQKEVERKARLLELNSEVFGKGTTDAKDTFIEVY